MAGGPVERAEERKRVTNIYIQYRVVGRKRFGFLKPTPKRGLVVNLSKSGMGVRVPEPVEPESVLDVDLELPERKEPIGLKAKVRWVRQQRKLGTVNYTHIFGAQFVEYSPESWRVLHNYLMRP